MKPKDQPFPDDRTEGERRKHLSDKQVRDLELAGGVEGGMQAGSAGGPSQEDSDAQSQAAHERRARPKQRAGH